MKALLISPESQTIEAIEIAGREDIVRLIGYDTIESDAVGKAGDRLFSTRNVSCAAARGASRSIPSSPYPAGAS
jgi:hypothetical protein